MSKRSSIVTDNSDTVLSAAIDILCATGESMGPTEIAERGIEWGWLKKPRGRTKGCVAQALQTKLQANATHPDERKRFVYRPSTGKYRARVRAY